ncbi:hypothetical protein [Fusobacterium necrophorum]|jgi:hypothetical protein|uniref:hypothetical protein n=1 Tax=Fusobacterium necrophorum TaxID=859 RepID=UPI00241DC43F|nr:hypothetical protein [Fusobacterium necrophorum]MDK4525114.1 hypothetical protein [Fusobacterium necrophorum]
MLYFDIKNNQLKSILFIDKTKRLRFRRAIILYNSPKQNHIFFSETAKGSEQLKENTAEALMILENPKEIIQQILFFLNKRVEECSTLCSGICKSDEINLESKMWAMSSIISELRKVIKYT